jgi:hypothetical protein
MTHPVVFPGPVGVLSKSFPKVRMSMKKMAVSSSVSLCSLAITACLLAYMQHTDEQYPLSQALRSRDPTHWIQAIFLGGWSSEGRTRWPS